MGSMLPYIAAPWILWGKSLRNIKNQTRPQNKATKATTVVGMTRKSIRDGQNGRIPDATHENGLQNQSKKIESSRNMDP